MRQGPWGAGMQSLELLAAETVMQGGLHNREGQEADKLLLHEEGVPERGFLIAR